MRSCLLLFVAASVVGCGGGDTADATDADGGASSSSSGGEDAGPKPVGAQCVADSECEGRCTDGSCRPPTTTDGKRSPSLGETDIDCGGTAPPCKEGQACGVDTDCATKACGTASTCVSAPSCKGVNGPSGIATCGTGEPGAQGAVVESCCKSLPLPTTPKRTLDRYEITAGRIRAFVSDIAARNGGEPNIRKFAKEYAEANPASELGQVATKFPGLLDVLPDQKNPTATVALPIHLGASPLDAMNTLDGCFVGPGAYGHATYWQPPEDLTPYGIGYGAPPDGKRKYGREVLDAKPMNCVMPMMLAAFCAWDGGELARTSDYREVWGRHPVTVGAATVFVPWSKLLANGEFNWRNGHGDACPIPGWPGCVASPPPFYAFPTGGNPATDDAPAIGAPGRFPLDVTVATSANGEGWFDIGGNLMEAAWPNGPVTLGATPIEDVCDTSAGPGAGATKCSRLKGADLREGTRRFTGSLPHIALVGYSFEVHSRRSEAYLASTDGAESRLIPGDLKPITFQYGKVGGRCARPLP